MAIQTGGSGSEGSYEKMAAIDRDKDDAYESETNAPGNGDEGRNGDGNDDENESPETVPPPDAAGRSRFRPTCPS